MKTKIFSKRYTINRITEYYNVSQREAEEIFAKTYEKIRYKSHDVGHIKGFSATRETFFSIFGQPGTALYVSTTIDPAMPTNLKYQIHEMDLGKNTFRLNIGKRLEKLIEKYPSVQFAYTQYLFTGDMRELNKAIEEFKRSPEYMKTSSK